MNINYDKLNKRIVEQAEQATKASELSPTDFRQIVEAKIARAESMIQARKVVADAYFQIED
jgi:hypothetical protein